MLDEELLKEFEKIALLMQNNCLDRHEDQCLKANYEIRSMIIIELQGASLLCYGDKSGYFWIVHRETGTYKPIEHTGVIDTLDYKILPGNQVLLFAVVRYKGIFVYRIEITGNEIYCREEGIIFETHEYIHFFYPHIVINTDHTIIRSEVWVGLDNGKFFVLENECLNKKKWEEKYRLDLPYTLSGCAVDIDPEMPHGQCNFFIGNSKGDIFCLEFDNMDRVSFPASRKELEDKRAVTIHGAFFEKMIPLSDYRRGTAKEELFYKDFSGCLTLTGNKAVCIYFKKEKGKGHIHTRNKVFTDQLLDIECLPFDDFCWTVVSDYKKRLHFIKNVTDMAPRGVKIEAIFDGEFTSIVLEDRIFKLCTIPVFDEMDGYPHLKFRGYLGMGNHTVVPIDIYDYEGKLNEARELFSRIVTESEETDLIEKGDNEHILIIIEKILDFFRTRSSRTAVKLLLLNLMTHMVGEFCKLTLSDTFSKIFYKIIDNERIDLIQKASGFLTRLGKRHPGFEATINEFHTHIKKFILDGASYSEKSENLKQLWEYGEETGNWFDSIVYRGILYHRQYDPAACFQFDKDVDGEITRIVPFKPFTFIISTSKGKLFIADFHSKHKRLVLEYKKNRDSPDTVLKINNIYLGKEYLFIFPSAPFIVVKHIAELESSPTVIEVEGQDECCLRIPGEGNYGTAVCQMPWVEEKGDECFVGANQGDIFYMNPSDQRIINITEGSPEKTAILDLRSFLAGGRHFIAAAGKNGEIKIYEYFHDRTTRLDHIKNIPVDTNAVNRLLVLFKEENNLMRHPLVIAGTDSGKCFGIRLMIDQNDNVENFKYIYEWCYQCDKAVKGVHSFSLAKGYNYILIFSMDSYLHFLEWDGICVNTVYMNSPLLQGYMESSWEDKDTKQTYQNAYAATMDNKLLNIRFFIRDRLMEEIDACFSGEKKEYEKFKEKDAEVLLLQFKTISIRELHFKIRYYLKSKDFNSPDQLLEEIEQILDRGKTELDSDTLIFLIHRLFSNFLHEILQEKKRYSMLMKQFIKTRDQWGYPGLKANTRAQLYWIRSMLKGCYKSKSKNPIESLNAWFVIGTNVTREVGMHEVGSKELIKHFINHPVLFIRVKTLQYFQRFIFNPKRSKTAVKKSIFDNDLVTALSDSVFSVLKMYGLELTEGSPAWFEMEAIRFFTWMVLNYKYTGLCPARLCYDLWENNIPSTFLFRLSDAIQISLEKVENKIEIAEMFQAAGMLMEEMKRENPQVIEILPGLMRFCQSCGKHTSLEQECSCKHIGHKFAQFFISIEKLLELSKIGHFKDAPNLKDIPAFPQDYFKENRIIKEFITLSRHVCQYYEEKSQDIYSLNAIKYPTFYQLKKSLADIRGMIDESKRKNSWLENALYSRVWKQWNDIVKNEMDNEVILDFANAIRNYNELCLSYDEPMDMEIIFKNIFTRLNMMAECNSSYLLYIDKKNERIMVNHNDREKEFHLSLKDPRLNRIPSEWLQTDTFFALADSDIHNRYKNDRYTHMLIKTPGIVPQKTSALYLFFWDNEITNGLSRLKSREILGEFIATVAYLQVAMEEQREQKEEFFRIVSHELNQYIRGPLAWMSNLTAGYLENEPEMRREYYERFQSSLVSADHVIRSLLTFRDSAVFNLKDCYLDKEIEKVLKNARVHYKEYGNIQLIYEKRDGEYEIINDPTLVGAAVMNMLTNARKYNPEKKPVHLRLYTESHKIVIEVEDRGIGIQEADFPIVFEPFKRGSFARENNIDGLGVGLAISKKNIESLGGTIQFESKVNVGSVFKIILNKRKFEKPHLLVSRVMVKKAPDFSAIKDIAKRKKILEKVDYNPNKNLLILRGILSGEEYKDLEVCYHDDDRTKEFNLGALEKLRQESQRKLDQLKTMK
ncbi:MAG: HAMP domain-containing sensor histidine kinase [Candidatus Aminicenantes bacterium]|nr:HAMP domain-containing sensor histidine kinase [Candidatus Aminicenantes bacterium]